MKDFVCIDVHSDASDVVVYEAARRAFPDFDWRRGDSDMQGPYVSGRNTDRVQIKIWLGEKPYSMTVSFQDVWPNDLRREERKGVLIDAIIKNLIPSLGNVGNLDA